MDELFEQFKRGEIPNVIELMAAISELSNYWPGEICLDCRTGLDSLVCDQSQKLNVQSHIL